MTSTRTEYAIRYTGRDGTPTIDMVVPTAYDDPEACQRVGDLGDWQEEMGLPIDAQVVSRTVTIGEWTADSPSNGPTVEAQPADLSPADFGRHLAVAITIDGPRFRAHITRTDEELHHGFPAESSGYGPTINAAIRDALWPGLTDTPLRNPLMAQLVTIDLDAYPAAYFVLTDALESFADRQEDKAFHEDSDQRRGWAATARALKALVEDSV